MAVYLTPDELLDYYDERRIRALVRDDNTSEATLSTNTKILTAIRNASAELDAALQVGKRYTRQAVEDLCDAAAAVGASDTVKKRAAPIKALIAHLVWGMLNSRRGYAAGELATLAPMYDRAQMMLQRLAEGVSVLDVDANIDAGLPTAVAFNNPTRIGIWETNGLFPGSSVSPYRTGFDWRTLG